MAPNNFLTLLLVLTSFVTLVSLVHSATNEDISAVTEASNAEQKTTSARKNLDKLRVPSDPEYDALRQSFYDSRNVDDAATEEAKDVPVEEEEESYFEYIDAVEGEEKDANASEEQEQSTSEYLAEKWLEARRKTAAIIRPGEQKEQSVSAEEEETGPTVWERIDDLREKVADSLQPSTDVDVCEQPSTNVAGDSDANGEDESVVTKIKEGWISGREHAANFVRPKSKQQKKLEDFQERFGEETRDVNSIVNEEPEEEENSMKKWIEGVYEYAQNTYPNKKEENAEEPQQDLRANDAKSTPSDTSV